jgi:hypothetical protein
MDIGILYSIIRFKIRTPIRESTSINTAKQFYVRVEKF